MISLHAFLMMYYLLANQVSYISSLSRLEHDENIQQNMQTSFS
jgi:hypothetical protein